jgi:superfamily I DNA/RNA helicase/PHD/YefM family antitoxin component YafN of YafNO toxin-antitoxin module
MALFVYITPKCEEEARLHNRWNDIEKLKNRTIKEQRTSLFDRYPPPYLKKRFARQERLIAGERAIGEHVVVCFYRLLIRGGGEYNQFKAAPVTYGDSHFATLADDHTLHQWLEEQFEQQELGAKPPPTELEHTFLWDIIAKDDLFKSDTYLYESEDWVNSIKNFQNRLFPIAEEIISITESTYSEADSLRIAAAGNVEVVYRCFPMLKKVFLAGIFSKDDSGEKDKVFERYQAILNMPLEDVNEEEIIRHSNRSYPALILADPDNWISIEENKESNLALSPEESRLLESAHDLEEKDMRTGFPLFINGRAGSGKSTILQYLFTDYVINYLKNKEDITPPLYLTYSEKLVQRSKEVVKNLVDSNYKYTAVDDISKEHLSESIKHSFREFKGFLLSLVNQEVRESLFPAHKYISYPNFKQEWEKKFSKDPRALKDFGPDISWHIIRTYIKGVSPDGYMDPEEYEELPDEERSVSKESYQRVHEKVWENWYMKLCLLDNPEKKHWDDQDLVRYILEKDLIPSIYPAVFCDEAQDFTRIELEAILRLSLFSERSLNSQELNRVPFAFAGDPLQTLNPTGFRWEAIKSVFVQKFIHSLDAKQRFGKRELNYRELSFNYRSTKNIVKLNNSIQAFRSALFDYRNISPQTTWLYEENSPSPVWFEKNDIGIGETIKKQGDLNIIVPCGEGGEKIFVQNDKYLASIIEIDEQGTPKNVLSPARAKGLEFKRVALYGFGEYMPLDFEKFISSIDDQEDPIINDRMLTYGYFINQLYVGASRPQRRLFIIDTNEGIKKLWRFAIDPEFQSSILDRIKNGHDTWRGHLGALQKGTPESWNDDHQDPLDLAKQLEQEGRSKPDSFLLRQAAMAYRQIDKMREYYLCRAKAFEIEDHFIDAGENYTLGGQLENAVQVLWRGCHYREIADLAKGKELSRNLEVRISTFLVDTPSTSQCQEILNELIDRIDENFQFLTKLISSKSWIDALRDLTKKLQELREYNPDKLKINISQLLVLEDKGIEFDLEQIANLSLKIGDLKRAVEIFERANKTNLLDYRKAKGTLLLDEFKQNPDGHFSNDELKLIADELFNQREYLLSAKIHAKSGSFSEIASILNEIIATPKHQPEEVSCISELFLEQLIINGQWIGAVSFVNTQEHRLLSGKSSSKIKQALKKKNQNWDVILIKEAALSHLLPISDTANKSAVSDYLKAKFLTTNQPTASNYLKAKPLNHRDQSMFEHIHPIVVGAAFERAGRDIDTLKYYEKAEKLPILDEKEKKTVTERWIKTKHKQAIRERDRGLTKVSEKHFEEAERTAKDHQIQIEELAEFPSISVYIKAPITKKTQDNQDSSIEISDITKGKRMKDKESFTGKAYSQKLSIDIGPFKIRMSRERKRINIEHEDTMETASLSFADYLTVKNISLDYRTENNQIEIDEWKMTLLQNEKGEVEITLKNEGMSLVIKS